MSEMVERVARAIYGAEWCEKFDDIPRDSIQYAMEMKKARAAIAALREPTAEIVDAGLSTLIYVNPDELETMWRFMIDASLGADLTKN